MADPDLEPSEPEREVAVDMARLSLIVGPVLAIGAALVWGWGGLASSLIAIAIVVFNLLLGAWIIGRAVAVSPNLLMGAVLGGFFLRLMLLSAVVLPIRDLGWFEVIPFAIALVGGHLGLLAWETQRVSASLAYPGLPPKGAPARSLARPRSTSHR
jgi:hypothetical protein